MAVEIGALRALLSLDSAAFESGVKRAQASMGKLQRGLAQTGRRMQTIGKRMTASITAPLTAATGLMVQSSIRAAVQIERMSALANAGVVEFQRFAAGAHDVGIEQEKVGDILKDVNDKVGDFLATGGGPLKDFFEQIAPKVGVTAEQFARLSGPDALQLYVTSLEKAGVSQQKMTFFMEALANDATLLLPLLRNNGAEMQRLGDRAEELGIVMDAETVESLNDTRDAMRDLKLAGSGLSNQLAASLAPAIETMSDAVLGILEWFSKLSPQIKSMIGIAAALAAAIGPITFALGLMVSGLSAATGGVVALTGVLFTLRGALMSTGIGALVVGAGALADMMFRVNEKTGNWAETLAAVFRVGKETFLGVGRVAWGASEILAGVASSIAGSFVRAFAEIAKSWDALVNGMSAAWNSIADTALGDQLGLGKLGRSDIGGTLGNLADGLFDNAVESIESGGRRIKNAGQGVADAISDIREILSKETETSTEATDQAKELQAVLDKIAESGGGAAGGIKEASDATEDLGDKADRAADRFGDMVAGIITGSQSAADALKQIGSQLISSGISGIASSLFKGSGLGDLFAGFFDGGGMIPAGQFGIAGERGPEIVTGPARVTSRADTARMMGGGGQAAQAQSLNVTVTMDESTGALGAFVRNESGRVVAQATPNIVRQSVGATYERAKEVALP